MSTENLAAELRSNPAAAARTILDALAAAGSSAVLEERRPLYYGYRSSQYFDIGNGPIAAGAPLNFIAFVTPDYDRFIPQIVVGTNADNVIDGIETGALAPSVITLTGTDLLGNVLVRTFNVSAKGAYSADRAFASYTSLVSNVDVGAPVHFLTGKGIGLQNPFDEDTIEIALADLLTFAPTSTAPTLLHGPTGTVIPAAVYNAGEVALLARYVATAG